MPSIRILSDEDSLATQAAQMQPSPTATSTPKIKIRNKATGEVREIDASTAQDYGLSPVEALSRLEAQQKIIGIESGKMEELGTSEQQFKLAQAKRAVEELENLYGRGSGENIGTKEDLSLSPSATKFGKLRGKSSAFIKSFRDTDYQEDLNSYKSQLAIATGILTQAFGSGTPQEGEAKRLIESAPSPISTDNEAKQWFASVRNLLGEVEDLTKNNIGLDENNLAKTAAETTMGFQNIEPDALASISPTEKKSTDESKTASQDNIIQNIALKAADIAPGAGALVGGLTGGIAGGGFGAIPGAAIGFSGGEVIKQNIRNLIGAQDKTAMEQLEEIGKGSATAAAYEAVGLGVGKYILKPIVQGGGWVLKSLMKNIDDLPLKGIRFNPSQLTKFVQKHKEDITKFMINRGYIGEDAVDLAAADAAKFQQKFDDFALNKNIQIPFQTLGKRFVDEIAELGGRTAEGGKRITPSFQEDIAIKLLAEWDNIVTQLKNQGRNYVTPEELTLFRRSIDDLIPDSQFVEANVKNLGIRIRRIINDVVAEPAGANLIGKGDKQGIKRIGIELSKLYDFLEMADKQSNLGRGSLVANLTRLLSVGGGATLGATLPIPGGPVIGAMGGLATEQLLRDPAVLKKILQASQALRSVGQKVAPAANAIPYASAALTQLLGQSAFSQEEKKN